jgi:MSHA pilin protein MshD
VTLVEALISVVILSVGLVAALNTLGSAARANAVLTTKRDGLLLGRELMGEIMASRYRDAQDNKGAIGREDSEKDDVRELWDDVDDYDGWSASPPQTKNGTPMDTYARWTREVAVNHVDTTSLAKTTLAVGETGLKRITITVTDPHGRTTTLEALRGVRDTSEPLTGYEEEVVSWVGIELHITDSTQQLTAGVEILNQPLD